jgi:Tol biopolymer transport system component
MRPLAFSPVGSWVLVFRPTTDRGFGEVGVLDIGSARYHRLTPRGMGSWCCFFGSPASWSPDGRVAFAAFQHVPQGDAFTDGQSAVFVTQRGTEGVRRVTDWGQWTTSAHWSPDSRLLAYDTANERGGAHDLFVIDPDGGSPSLVPTPNDGGSCCAVWTPNGKALVYESGSDDAHMDLWAANLDGSGTFRLTSGNARDLAYAITPWP